MTMEIQVQRMCLEARSVICIQPPPKKSYCKGKYNENITQRFDIKVSGIRHLSNQETNKYKFDNNGNTSTKNVSGSQISFMYSAPSAAKRVSLVGSYLHKHSYSQPYIFHVNQKALLF